MPDLREVCGAELCRVDGHDGAEGVELTHAAGQPRDGWRKSVRPLGLGIGKG